MSIEFEWDEQKRLSNLEKHGIDFIAACQIFDGYTVDFEDNRYDYGEDRFIAIGEINGQILTVVYTYPDDINQGDMIRLISARRASKNERSIYY